MNYLLLFVGYLAIVLLAIFILSIIGPEAKDDDIGWLVAAAIFWPCTLALAALVIVFAGPIFLGMHLFDTGQRIGLRRRRGGGGKD